MKNPFSLIMSNREVVWKRQTTPQQRKVAWGKIWLTEAVKDVETQKLEQ